MPEQKSVELLTAGEMLPMSWEFGILFIVMLQLLIAGYLLKGMLFEKYQTVPVKFAGLMLVAAAVVLGIQTNLLREEVDTRRTLVIMGWCLLFALPTLLFYIKIFVDALSEQSSQRVSPMGTKIDELGEFAAARKLAQKGDIDGAITLYRGYRENRTGAMLEAARLLRKEERYAEAVSLFNEISERFTENKVIWAEATYSLAKIMETNLNQPIGAMQHYNQLCRRAAGTKYAHMASSDLNRLQVMTGTKIGNLESTEDGESPSLPDIAKIQIPTKYNRENMAQDLLDAPIPERDPFMTRDIYTIRGVKPPKAEEPAHKAVVKKVAAKKSASSKKKAAASPKAPAKKKSTAKKKAAATKAVVQKVIGGEAAPPEGKVPLKPKVKTKAKAKTAPKKKAVPKAKTSTLAKKKAAARKKTT